VGFPAQIEAHHAAHAGTGVEQAAAQLGKVVEKGQQCFAPHRGTAVMLGRGQHLD
jgi:hypothetical protein